MSYKLKQTSPESVEVTSNLESFCFFYSFKVNQSKIVELQKGYFAVYISQRSGKPFIQSFYDNSNEEKKNVYRKLEISNLAEQKISINDALLANSRLSQFSNEVSQLHLFELFDEEEARQDCIDTKGWTPKFKNPTQNDDGKYFLRQTFSLGQATDRYIYWLAEQANNKKTERFSVAVPFIANSLTGTILALHKQELPKIQIIADEKTWPYPKEQELPTQKLRGYVMVAEGAFKAIPLTGEVDNLMQQTTSNKTSEEILTYLSQIVHGYPTPISRTLNTAAITKSNSVVPSEPELPIEVLCLEGLNSESPVDMIIK